MFADPELRDWHRLMLEKGLRVRVDFDPNIGMLEEQQAAEERMLTWDLPTRVEQGDVTVAEDLLREREQLKPY